MKRAARKNENIESLIETAGFIKDHMATKEDLKESEEHVSGKIEKIDSKLGAFENSEVDKRKQLEVRVAKLERKVLS